VFSCVEFEDFSSTVCVLCQADRILESVLLNCAAGTGRGREWRLTGIARRGFSPRLADRPTPYQFHFAFQRGSGRRPRLVFGIRTNAYGLIAFTAVPPLILPALKVVFGSAGTSYPVSPHTRSAVHNSRWIAAVDRHEKERLVCFDASFVHRFSDREEV